MMDIFILIALSIFLFVVLYLDVIKFIIPRLEKNAIILLDDYNLINQEGVKWAVKDSGINIGKCIQTQSGQLICYT